jgi:hypothetical protein
MCLSVFGNNLIGERLPDAAKPENRVFSHTSKQARTEFVGARLQPGEAREIQSEWIRDALLSVARRASGR